MDGFDRFLAEEFERDPEFKREYEALEPKYQLIKMLIGMRLNAGLTQAQLAERIGTKQSVISRIERGRVTPSFDMLLRIAQACGVTLKFHYSADAMAEVAATREEDVVLV